jgi:hypothetical protein
MKGHVMTTDQHNNEIPAEDTVFYKYGLRYTIRRSLGDKDDEANKYNIEVEIAVQLDPREFYGHIEGELTSEDDMPYLSLASVTGGVSELTEENEQMVIDQMERQVGALYRKLRWKRKGRV